MPALDRARFRSSLRSPSVFVAALRARARRYRVVRIVIVAGVIGLVAIRLDAAHDAATSTRDRWAPGSMVWVATRDIAAGTILEAGTTAAVEVPRGLIPADATTEDPIDGRTRVDLAAGEILRDDRIAGRSSAHAALTPPGTVTVALDRTSDLFSVGDRVDLHDLIDGRRLATDAVIVAVGDRDLGVAVDEAAIGEVVRGLGRGGIVTVLRAA